MYINNIHQLIRQVIISSGDIKCNTFLFLNKLLDHSLLFRYDCKLYYYSTGKNEVFIIEMKMSNQLCVSTFKAFHSFFWPVCIIQSYLRSCVSPGKAHLWLFSVPWLDSWAHFKFDNFVFFSFFVSRKIYL